MERLSLARLTWIYFKISSTTFGGGDPTMMALQREFTERRGWLSHEAFGLAYSIARITPGTNVLAFCAGAAYLLRGWWAAVLAVLAGSLSPAVIVVWLTLAYENATRFPVTRGAVGMMLAAITGMMLASIWLLVKPFANHAGVWRIVVITGGTVLLREGLGWSPVPIMGLAAAAGWFWLDTERQA